MEPYKCDHNKWLIALNGIKLSDGQYTVVHSLQIMIGLGVTSKMLPKIPLFVEVVYATATAALFHLSITEPQSLKPSYFAFMNRITGDRCEPFINDVTYKAVFPNLCMPYGTLAHLYQYSGAPFFLLKFPDICAYLWHPYDQLTASYAPQHRGWEPP